MLRLVHRLRFRRDHRWVPAHASAYLDSELGPGQRRRVERHTEDCPQCCELLRSLRVLIGALGATSGDQPQVVATAVLASIQGRLRDLPQDSP